MNKLIITLAVMALSQGAMSEEKNTLEKAQEVSQRMRAEADREYAKGVAKRSELHQWSDAADAVKRIQARYDMLELMRHNAQVAYDYYNWHIWCGDTCMDHKRAARHWQGFRDRTQPYIAIAKSHIKTSGTTMGTELARAKLHLTWAKMEKRWADSMVHIVKTQYKTGDYIDEAERTASTAYADLVWAEASVRRVTKVVNAVSNTALEKVRQSKYKLADAYVTEQRSIYEAEQAAIAEKQAAIVTENEFVQLLQIIMRRSHGTEQGE
jgi:hypothetical protein